MEGEINLIQFRNKYAHGATPKNEECEIDIEFYLPRLILAIEKASYFSHNIKELEPHLEGLIKEETIALLNRFINKYEVESNYIDELIKVSEGNPHYINMVIQELQAGTLKINDFNSLPKKLI